MKAYRVEAPWSDWQVEWLREWQSGQFVHPYTCGRCRDLLDVEGVLEPRADGWHCSTCPPEDNPVQTWALFP